MVRRSAGALSEVADAADPAAAIGEPSRHFGHGEQPFRCDGGDRGEALGVHGALRRGDGGGTRQVVPSGTDRAPRLMDGLCDPAVYCGIKHDQASPSGR